MPEEGPGQVPRGGGGAHDGEGEGEELGLVLLGLLLHPLLLGHQQLHLQFFLKNPLHDVI